MAIKRVWSRLVFLLLVMFAMAMSGTARAQNSYEITATGIHFTNGPAGVESQNNAFISIVYTTNALGIIDSVQSILYNGIAATNPSVAFSGLSGNTPNVLFSPSQGGLQKYGTYEVFGQFNTNNNYLGVGTNFFNYHSVNQSTGFTSTMSVVAAPEIDGGLLPIGVFLGLAIVPVFMGHARRIPQRERTRA